MGTVGAAVRKYFENKNFELFFCDKGKKIGSIEEVNKSEIVFICVQTPFIDGKGCDTSFVREACQVLSGNKTIIIKSTVPPGTTEKLQQEMPFHKFIFNPEFLTEMNADYEMENPERQIIGCTKESIGVGKDILNFLPKAPFERIISSTEAEMVKYFGNTWLAVRVIFANQIYDLCQKMGIDYDKVKESAAQDKRIGSSHLDIFHGGYRGYDGKCLPKDIRSFISFADSKGVDLKIHKSAEEINKKLRQEK